MTLPELYDYFGSWTQASMNLKINLSTLHNWRRQGYIPYAQQCVIEKHTLGKLIAQPKEIPTCHV